MRKILAALANFIAFIFATLFVVVTPLTLVLSSVGWQMFGPDLYKRALADQGLYERLPALAAAMLVSSMTVNPCAENPDLPACLAEGEPAPDEPPQEGGPPAFLEALTPATWESLLAGLMPRDWLRTQTESVIDQVFAYLDSDAPNLTITISTREVREHIAGEAGVEAVLELVRAQPPCTEAEALQLAASALSGDMEGLLICRPPDELLAALTPQIAAALGELVAQIPDEVQPELRLGPGAGEASQGLSPRGSGPLDDPRQAFQILRLALRLTPLLPALLLLLVTLFGVRSLKGWLRWWGIPFAIVGAISAGIVLAGLPIAEALLAAFVADKLPPYLPAALGETGLGLARYLARALAAWIGVGAGAIAAVGTVMLLGSLLVRTKRR